MTTENTPVPPEQVPSIVDSLEPELAAAYRAGVPSVVQAVAGGATTSQQVVNDLIRTGASASGLPAGVAALVEERRREAALKADQENTAIARTAAAALGMGMMATRSANGDMYYGGEGSARNYTTAPPTSAEFSQMSGAERLAYYEQRQNMTLGQWSELSEASRDQHHQLDADAGAQGITSYADRMVELNREMKRNISQEQIDIVTSVGNVLTDAITNDTSPEGLKKQEALLKQRAAELARQHPNIPAHYFERYAENQHGVLEQSALEDAGNAGLRANQNGAVSTSHQQQQTGAQIGALEEQRKQEKALDKRDDLDKQVEVIMDSGATVAVTNSAIQQRNEYQQDRIKQDAEVAKAEFVEQARNEDEFSNDAPAPAVAASAATPVINTALTEDRPDRPKTVAASSLGMDGSAGLALLGAPEVVAASGPNAPDASNEAKLIQPSRPKASTGMG